MSVSNIFETLMVTGVAPGLDNQQTALAVQALLESQSIPEATAPVAIDEDDVFQCGKCKKQFNNISLFVTHKQSHCTGLVQNVQGLQNISLRAQTPAASNVTQQVAPPAAIPTKQLSGYSAVPSSPLAQSLGHNIVLTDDLINFTNPVDSSVPTSSLQVGSNPFLSQVSPGTTPHSSAPSAATTLLVTTATTVNSNSYTTTTTAAGQSYGSHHAVQSVQSSIQPGATYTASDANGSHIIIQPNGEAVPQASLVPSGAQMLAGAGVLTTASSNKPVSLPSILRTTTNKTGHKLTSVTLSNGQIAMISEEDLALTSAPAQIPPAMPQATATANPPIVAPPPTQTPKSRRTKPVPEEPNGKKKLKCQYCDKTFAKNFDLQQHIRSHTGEKPFQCIVCGRAFAQKSNVKKHMQTHKVWPQGTGKTLPSQPPPKIISQQEEGAEKPELLEGAGVAPAKTIQMSLNKKASSDDVGAPVKLNVVIDSSYMCQYCPTKCKSYFQLKSHMLQHKSEQVYKCVVKNCNQTFGELDNFLEHTKAHEDDMSYRCHMCSKVFPSLYELGVHQYSHSLYPNQGPKPGPRYFRCVKCNSKYATPAALQHHLDTVSHKHQCPHCHKIFTCERYLRRHLPIHGSTGPHVCETCNKQFKTEHYLKVHQLTHSSEKPFSCEFCMAAFNRKDKLKRHMLVHETTKKYKCPFRAHLGCTKEFHRPDKLKAHIICHSGVKPFKCKECGKMFTRRPNLRQHERGHQKDWSYTCSKCGKGFLREKLYKMHKCRNLEKVGKIRTEKEVDGFIPTELHPKETVNRRVFRSGRGQVTRRAGRQKRGFQRAGSQRKSQSARRRQPPQEEEIAPTQTQHVEVVLNSTSGSPGTTTTIQDVAIAYPTEVEPGEISVVLDGTAEGSRVTGQFDRGGTTAQYIPSSQEVTSANDNSTAAVITAEDGNVVVIQSLSQVPAEFTGLPQGSEVHYTEHIKPEGELVASGTTSTSGAEIQYNLDYSPSIYQTAYNGGNATFQNATFITTGPNMATLVVEGPGGEVLTQENIATIVAQAPDQFSSDAAAQQQTYDVLEYPMATEQVDDPQEVAIMPTQDIVPAEAVTDQSIKNEN